jgi:hypothetical protein
MDEYLAKRSINDGQFENWTQKEIDISANAILKYKNDDIGGKLESLIPNFSTRLASNEN